MKYETQQSGDSKSKSNMHPSDAFNVSRVNDNVKSKRNNQVDADDICGRLSDSF